MTLRLTRTTISIALVAAAVGAGAWLAVGDAGPRGTSTAAPASDPVRHAPLMATGPHAAGLTVQARGPGGAELFSDGSMLLPLDSYDGYGTDVNESLIYRAVTKVEQRCMQAEGLTLPQGWGGNYLPTVLPPLVYFGVATVDDAKTYGYRLPQPVPASAPPSAVPEAVTTAFYGKPGGDGGCLQQAVATLDIDKAVDAYGEVQTLRMKALDDTHQDPLVKAANAAWSACMKTAGYSYPDPLTASNDKALLGSGSPSSAEKQTAAADATCKQHTGYEQTFMSADATHQLGRMASEGSRLDQVLKEWRDVLDKATAVTVAT
ncbi:hypothetical protein GCM10009839_06900 [Catenulispora yoronensis]|uniref:Secreted protein n=1 Tax=Catenulispora yoronensis TaxID=450799 RepID=A0ABP5F6X0_9ACTN